MPDHTNWRSVASTRRDFIKAGAVGGAAFVAGCSGDTGATGDGESGGGSTVQFTVFDPLTSGANPADRHLNPWNPSQTGAWHPGAAIMDRPVVYSPTRNEGYPLMVEEWEMTGDTTLEATFSDQWSWHNGEPFTAEDYVMEQQIEIEIGRATAEEGARAHDTIKRIEAVDDQLVRIELHDPLSETFAVQNTIGAYNGNLPRGIFTYRNDDTWSDFHERLRNTSGSEKEAIAAEVTSSTYPKITSENAIGHGPFQIKNVGDNQIVMEKYEEHPHADNINFDEFVLQLFSTDKPTQPYSAGEVDAAHKGFPVQEDVRSQLPEGHTLFREGRSSNKLFSFNCGHQVDYESPVNDRRVRKAICHVFDRQQVSGLLQGVNRLFEWPPCRVPGKVLREGEHEATQWVQDFTTYGQNNTERAAELMRQAGYEQDSSGEWIKGGEQLEIGMMNAAERPDFNILSKNLRDFGIAVNQEQVDSATFDERRNTGDYDMMPDGSSANGITAMWSIGLVPEWLGSILHFDPDAEIPMPVGDPEGSSGTKSINVREWIRQWQSTGDSQYHNELMWWWNQYVPEMEAMYQPDAGAYNGDNWELDVRSGIKNGVDDALYIAPKMPDGAIRYTGN
ncbi:ABC transporter substrate-binding protein (plasmid) [Haloarcula salina]|uniref:ABC transporter substrate-binding protein n=1 Tax=Haloarcula salina TaxID=1429914 RepID=UPI003C6FE8F0